MKPGLNKCDHAKPKDYTEDYAEGDHMGITDDVLYVAMQYVHRPKNYTKLQQRRRPTHSNRLSRTTRVMPWHAITLQHITTRIFN